MGSPSPSLASLTAPSTLSPTQQAASSLLPNEQLLIGGMTSYVSDYLRAQTDAKLLLNLLQSRRQGVWSSADNGYTTFMTNTVNAGSKIYEFGQFLDANNRQQLLAQVGSQLLWFDIINASITAIKTDLSTAGPMCFRQFRPFQAGVSAQTIITQSNYASPYDSAIQPYMCNTAGVVQKFFLNSNRTVAVLSGTITVADTVSIIVYNAALSGYNPMTITHTIILGDTLLSIATSLAAAINANGILGYLGVIAASSGTSIILESTSTTPTTYTGSVTGSSTEAINFATDTGAVPSLSYWGETAAPLPVNTYSRPEFCEPFLDRMIFASFQDPKYPEVYQDILITNEGYFSKCAQTGAGLLSTDGVVLQVPPICGKITAIKVVNTSTQANSQVVIVGCEKGVCLIQGADATNFGLVVVTTNFGVPSNRAIIQLQADVLFVASDGIRAMSSLVVNANLLPSAISYPLQDIVNNWDQKNLKYAHVVHSSRTRDVQFWIPTLTSAGATSSGACYLGMVFNYGSSQPNVSSLPSMAFSCSLRNQGTFPDVPCSIEFQDYNKNNQWTVLAGSAVDGHIYKHYSGNTANGTPIPFIVTFPLIGTGTASVSNSFELIDVVCEGGPQQFVASMEYIEMLGNGTTRRTSAQNCNFQLSSSGTSAFILSKAKLGISALGSGYTTQFLRYNPIGGGRFGELTLSGNSADNTIDLLGANYIMSVGGTRT